MIYKITMRLAVPPVEVYQYDLDLYGTKFVKTVMAKTEEKALDWFRKHHPIKCLDDWDICIEESEPIKEPEKTLLDLTLQAVGVKDIPSNEAPKFDQQEAKPDMSKLPMDLLEEVVKAYELGSRKGYPRNSWRKGFHMHRLVAASRRHDKDFWDKREIFDKQGIEEYDIEVYHCAQVIFNQLCLLDTLINHPEFIDKRFKPEGEEDGSNHRPEDN